MRGAQPATSAGARLFAGSPISGALTVLKKGRYRDQETRIFISDPPNFKTPTTRNRLVVETNIPARNMRFWACMKTKIALACCRGFYGAAFGKAAIRAQSMGMTVLASKRNGPLRRGIEKGNCNNQRFVQRARFCE